MKAYHKNPQWLVFTKLRRSFAEQLDQLVVDDFDDLLTGRYRFEYFLAQARLFDLIDEFTGRSEMHVGRKQRFPNFSSASLTFSSVSFPLLEGFEACDLTYLLMTQT